MPFSCTNITLHKDAVSRVDSSRHTLFTHRNRRRYVQTPGKHVHVMSWRRYWEDLACVWNSAQGDGILTAIYDRFNDALDRMSWYNTVWNNKFNTTLRWLFVIKYWLWYLRCDVHIRERNVGFQLFCKWGIMLENWVQSNIKSYCAVILLLKKIFTHFSTISVAYLYLVPIYFK